MPVPVLAIVMPLIVLVLMVVVLGMACRRAALEIDALDLPVRVRCCDCRGEFEMTIADLRRAWVTKSVSSSRTRARGGALVTSSKYSKFQKRLTCPICGKRGWCEVENINELQSMTTRIALKHIGAALIFLLVVGAVLSAVVPAVL